MKKKIIYFAAIFFVVLSCGEDFTTVPAGGALSDEALQNETGVDLLLTGAYSTLDGFRQNLGAAEWTGSGDNWWFDVLADDAHKGSTDGDQADLFELEVYNWQTSNPYILGRWNALFAGVNRANAVINLINNLEGDFNAKEAEARFLRAHYNFELVKIYGNVPFISVENFANTEFNQPNPGPIWDQIESDFQFAIDNLPATQPEPGRANSWAAKAYLGKVHLYQSDWGQALTLLQDVINNGPYSLNAEYVDNFTAAGENGPESIFAIQFAADPGQSFNGNRGGTLNFPNPGPFNSCCGFYQPTQDLANAFKTDGNGLPLPDTYNDSDIANDAGIASDEPFTPETGPLDPRIDYTVGRRGIVYNRFELHPGKDWIRADFADISGPYLPVKNVYFADELDANQGTGAWGQQRSGINYNIIRYADVLLMAAEAAIEANGDVATALDYVNQVRDRAKNSTPVMNEAGDAPAANYEIEPYTSFPDADFARKAVRFERRIELGMEGHRLFDLRRWGIAEQVINEYTVNESRAIPNFGTKVGTYEPRHNLLPIPLNAIDLSQGILTQNPGF